MHRNSVYRLLLPVIALMLLLPLCTLRAQGAEEGWKSLVMQALYAAGENQYAKSEQLFLKAVHEAERFGARDARVGTTLNSLGLVYRAEKKYLDAESAYRRALNILETAYGMESVDVANVNYNLGGVFMDEGKHAAAIPYLVKTLSSYQALLGATSIKTASVYCMLGDSYLNIKDYSNAIVNLKKCGEIREADGGIQNPELAEALRSIAVTYGRQGKFSQAEANFKLAEKIVENTSGLASAQLAGTMEDHIALLRQIGGREKDVERLVKLDESIKRLLAKKQK